MKFRPLETTITLLLLGVFLLMPPFVLLFSSSTRISGIPVIVLYVLGIWLLLIICTALLSRLYSRH